MAKDLMEMPLSEGACESARIISDCADHLLGLVNDILDFARIESKYVDCECQHMPHPSRLLIACSFFVGGWG
jgi:signal transduction histidine kinase